MIVRLTMLAPIVVIMLVMPAAFAQAQEVTGTVTSTEGDALPGVNIIVKGTTTGAISDIDGKYQMQVPDGSTLIFSYVGYKTQEIAVGNQSVIDVALVSLRPVSLGEEPAIEFELSFANAAGLRYRSLALASQAGGVLTLLLYYAPADHYFERERPAVEAIFRSLRRSS